MSRAGAGSAFRHEIGDLQGPARWGWERILVMPLGVIFVFILDSTREKVTDRVYLSQKGGAMSGMEGESGMGEFGKFELELELG